MVVFEDSFDTESLILKKANISPHHAGNSKTFYVTGQFREVTGKLGEKFLV